MKPYYEMLPKLLPLLKNKILIDLTKPELTKTDTNLITKTIQRYNSKKLLCKMKFLQYLQCLRSVCVCRAVVGLSSEFVETLSLFSHVGVNQHLSGRQCHLIIMSKHTE